MGGNWILGTEEPLHIYKYILSIPSKIRVSNQNAQIDFFPNPSRKAHSG